MNVLHINSYYSKSMFYKNLFDYQELDGVNIDVFVPVSNTFKYSSIDKFGKYTNISSNYKRTDRLFYFKKQNKIRKDIERKYNLKKYSIIHAHSLFTNGYIAMKLKLKYGIPYIVAVRNTDMNIFLKYLIHLRKIGIKILEEADQIIFLSSSYRELLVNKFIPKRKRSLIQKKSKVIPNGIDDFWLKNIGTEKSINKESINLLFVGDINQNKNVLTTIKSIKMLRKNGYYINFTIVGKVVNKRIYRRIQKHSFISYYKPMSKEDLLNIYRSHDIFIMPSKHETFGLVYAEAMSQGTPVIYSKGEGFDSHFKNGEIGLRVEYDQPGQISKSIKNILSNYKQLSSESIEKSYHFNWKTITEKYIQLYKALLK